VRKTKKMPSSERIVHNLINGERRKRGIAPVKWDNHLYRLAKSQASYCAKIGKLVHSNRYAYQGGENLCGGKGNVSPRTIVTSWLKSKQGHREYMLSRRATYAAVALSKSRHGTYCAWAFSDNEHDDSKIKSPDVSKGIGCSTIAVLCLSIILSLFVFLQLPG
jgi:uncharacterized protein YkwD